MRRALPLILIVLFAALMALCAQINVPMVPVPMTMQTFAVLVAGAVLGPWRGAASVLLYLATAALGLPILSDGASGLAPFSGSTAGYLFAFPVAALLAGADRIQRPAQSPWTAWSTMGLLHMVILIAGTLWLATHIGFVPAVEAGFAPFVLGAIVKSALVVAATRCLPFRGGGPRSGGGAPTTRTV